MLGKGKSSKLSLGFPPIVSASVVFTYGSEPISIAGVDGTLTPTLSVATVTINTNVPTPTTAPATSQVATENCLWMMGKSIVCLGDTLTRFIEDQKITSSSTCSRQRNLCRSRHKDHYSYYKRSCLRSPQRFTKSSRHYFGYQRGGRSSSPGLSLNVSQSEVDDKHGKRFQYRHENEEDEQ